MSDHDFSIPQYYSYLVFVFSSSVVDHCLQSILIVTGKSNMQCIYLSRLGIKTNSDLVQSDLISWFFGYLCWGRSAETSAGDRSQAEGKVGEGCLLPVHMHSARGNRFSPKGKYVKGWNRINIIYHDFHTNTHMRLWKLAPFLWELGFPILGHQTDCRTSWLKGRVLVTNISV